MAFSYYYTIFLISLLVLHTFQGKGGGVIRCTTFTFVNKCRETIWPAILGTPKLETTGFQLPQGTSSPPFQAPPTGWSGRFWGRTGCTFDQSGHGSCATGDCGSGEMECNGAGATAATLAEFTLGPTDFYDVSLVDGYNLPLTVDPSDGGCASTGCAEDLNSVCPVELRTQGGRACRSACDAFNTAEYCCSGDHGSPATCRPSVYSQIFKSACPNSYSYAYDDATSTFTCTTAAAYVITFCPLSQNSDNGTTNTEGSSSESGNESDGSGSGQEAILADGSWLAALATGDSTSIQHSFLFGFGYSILILIAVQHLQL